MNITFGNAVQREREREREREGGGGCDDLRLEFGILCGEVQVLAI